MEQIKPKSFWQKPEGKTGGILLLAIIAAVGVGVYQLLPYLITLMQNMLYLTLLGVGFAALLYVLFDPTFRNNIWTLYKMAMRKMTGMVIELDPIAIQEMHIGTLKEKRVEMDTHLSQLNGSRAAIAQVIQTNEKSKQSALTQATVAQREMVTNPRMKNQFIFQTAEAGRYDSANKDLIPVQSTIDVLYNTLSKVYDDSEWLVKDLESQVRINKIKYKAIKEGTNTIRAAGKFFNNTGAEQEMFLASMEYVEQDMAARVGEIDRFIQNTTTIMDSIDLKNGVMQENGVKMLAEFQNTDYTSLLQPINITDIPVEGDSKSDKILLPKSTPSINTSKSNNKFENL